MTVDDDICIGDLAVERDPDSALTDISAALGNSKLLRDRATGLVLETRKSREQGIPEDDLTLVRKIPPRGARQ